ncbi:DMSO reductase anchor subunit (DmsC) [mine drainage metagenome]|uniref:DMSO reductase anchor subunit (DmsC) n=1 Tax=mine drainage metagenome TaxID=410659 RepID=A0A1J5PRA6_9ZZZZ
MRPAWSVLILTTWIGCAQGLAVALALVALGAFGGLPAARGVAQLALLIVLLLGAGGLIASFPHLGRPERAWRAAAMWRTSWLSREVIALPAFLGVAALCWAALRWGESLPQVLAFLLLALAAAVLWVCTAMIYAGVRFIREWATLWTLVNFVLMGLASGFILAALLFAWHGLPARGLAASALGLTLAAALARTVLSLRNARLQPAGSLATAIGVRPGDIRQISRGFTAGSFNLREFTHGASAKRVAAVQMGFAVLGFGLPLALLGAATGAAQPTTATAWLLTSWLLQMVGLALERWWFFAQVQHPQNRYYAAAH